MDKTGGRTVDKSLTVVNRKRKLTRDDLTAYLMLAPKFLLFLAFTVYPILWALRFVFFDYDGVTTPEFIGLENFVRAFTRDSGWWRAVLNTFVFALGKLAIEIPLALVLAVVLNSKLRGKSIYRGIFFMPTVTSAAVMSLVFSFIFSPYNGALNEILRGLGMIKENISWLDSPKLAMLTVIIVAVWQMFGQNMILILSGLQSISNDVYESARIDGASELRCFFSITLPLLAPMLQLIIMLALIGSLGAFDVVQVLTNGGPNGATKIMSLSIYEQFFASNVSPSYGYGATLALLSALIIGALTAMYMVLSKKMSTIDE